MILNIIIIVFFVGSAWLGWRRGLFVQLMTFVSMILAGMMAILGYQWLSGVLRSFLLVSVRSGSSLQVLNNAILTQIDGPIFASISFTLIYLLVRIVLRLLMTFLRPFRKFLSLGKFGKFLSALLAFVISYLSLQLTLTMLSLFPITSLQNFLAGSDLARMIILYSPLSSHFLLQLFVENLTHVPAY